MRKGIFITGTDTGVGKTVIAAAICRGLQGEGIACVAMKPVETGACRGRQGIFWPDGEFLKNAGGINEDINLLSPFRFKRALSPQLAARLERRRILLEKIKGAFDNLSARYQMVIVEGAGGPMVPLNKDLSTVDLIKALDIPIVIVSRLSLGTINHTLLTIEAARNSGIEVLGIIFNQTEKSSCGICEKTNPQTIADISGVPVLGIIPYAKSISVEKNRTQGLSELSRKIDLIPFLRDKKDNSRLLVNWDKKYLWHPFTQMRDWLREEPLVIEEGKGSFIKDTSGKWYLDGVSSLWVNVHGHRHRELDEALRTQINKISHSTLLGLSNVPAIKLAKELIAIAPPGLKKVFYSDCGSTAVEVALKLAFQFWQQRSKATQKKKRFIRFTNAYHGDTLGAVSVGGIDLFHKIYAPLLFKSFKVDSSYCFRCSRGLKFPDCKLKCGEDAEKILKLHHQEIAGLIIEPLIWAAAGMLTQPPGFLKKIERLCRRYKVLLICDEVATGFGRTGAMFACEKEKVAPDILCLAKGLTGGYLPLAATLTTEKIFKGFLGGYGGQKTFFHGHTYTGNPLACSAALASLEIFRREKVIQKLQRKISWLKSGLNKFRDLKHVGDIRQCGFMVGIELVNCEDKIGIKVCQAARKFGVILRPLGNVIVLMPPLSITLKELDLLLDAAYRSIQEVTR